MNLNFQCRILATTRNLDIFHQNAPTTMYTIKMQPTGFTDAETLLLFEKCFGPSVIIIVIVL